jgi:thioredoxin
MKLNMNPEKAKKITFERFDCQMCKAVIMRRMLGVLLVTALIASSCGNSGAKNERGSNPAANNTGSLAAEPDQETAAPVTTVAETTSEANGGALTDTAMAKGGTILLNKSVFLTKVWDYEKSPQQWVYLGERPAIIDFYADWCGPCKIAAPILEEISHEFAGKVDVYKIDTQKEQELAAVFGIRGIPAFLYIPKNGQPTMTSGIARSKEDTKAMFVDNIKQILKVD